MKAAVYYKTGKPEVFRYEEVPDPVVRPGGILVSVRAISIEGGDVLNRAGGAMASTPHIVGYQAAGVVREVGDGVVTFTPGQRVVCTMPYGSHAEMVSVPARSAFALPEGMDLVQAACIPIAFGTAHDCLFEFGHLKAGETVLVQAAAGGVGLAAVQLAKRAGATVLGTASTDERLARLREFGLDTGINYVKADPVAAVMGVTAGRGVDLVVDSVGGRTLEHSLASLAYRGRVTWVGRAGRDAHTPEIWPLMGKNASVTGVSLAAEMGEQPLRTRSMIEQLIQDCASGDLKVVVDRTFDLSDAAAAHACIEGRQAFGRVVLVPRP